MATVGGVSLGGFAYSYDATGRIVERDFVLGDPSSPSNPSQPSPMPLSSHKTYSYDDLDRLAMDGDVSYIYDAAGNRLAKIDPTSGTTLYTLGLGDRLATYGRARSPSAPQSGDDGRAASPLAAVGSYAYDTAGNVTHIVRENGTTLDLTWNGQYQLASVSTNGAFAESYAYDALGRRVSTTTQEGTIRHIYDDRWQCIADIDENNTVVCSYVWGEGIDNLLAVKVGGNAYYPLTDIQGTVWGYVDSANNVVAHFDYDAWGNILASISTVPALARNRYRFQGREWSAVTGLTNFRMRWYDAETGRWVSKDPIGLGGGLNLYVFCGNDAVNCIDSHGTIVIAIGGVGSAGASTGGSVGSGIVIGYSKKNGFQFGTYQTGSLGSHVGLDASFGMGLTIAPSADDICDIAGGAVSSGGSGGLLAVSVGGEITVPLDGNPNGTSLTISAGAGVGAEGHVTATFTQVQKVWGR